MKIETLIKRKEKLEERIKVEKVRSTKRWAKIGWGTGMRCSKIPISFRKENDLQYKLEELIKEIESKKEDKRYESKKEN